MEQAKPKTSRAPKEAKAPKEPAAPAKRVRTSTGSSGKRVKAEGASKGSAEVNVVGEAARAGTPVVGGEPDGEDLVASKPDPSVGRRIVVIHPGSKNLRIGQQALEFRVERCLLTLVQMLPPPRFVGSSQAAYRPPLHCPPPKEAFFGKRCPCRRRNGRCESRGIVETDLQAVTASDSASRRRRASCRRTLCAKQPNIEGDAEPAERFSRRAPFIPSRCVVFGISWEARCGGGCGIAAHPALDRRRGGTACG